MVIMQIIITLRSQIVYIPITNEKSPKSLCNSRRGNTSVIHRKNKTQFIMRNTKFELGVLNKYYQNDGCTEKKQHLNKLL